jgi:lipopolysaccharide/colanic/teichoic acid biosynthesis glycosyltransferase
VQGEQRLGDRRRILSEGRLFWIHKFRTMIVGAEDGVGPVWALEHDPRVTRVGRWLRLLRLDELPQLWNVLKGEMSLVGPRPERPHFVGRFAQRIPGYTERLRALPGITGLAQVERSYDASEEDVRNKLRYDLTYVRNCRLSEDVRILFRTVPVCFRVAGEILVPAPGQFRAMLATPGTLYVQRRGAHRLRRASATRLRARLTLPART